MKMLIENPELRYEIAKNAHERVFKEYSLDNMGQNLQKIIQKIEEDSYKNLTTIKSNNKKKNSSC